MKKYLVLVLSLVFAAVATSFAGPTKESMMEKENAAWQSYKDKKADDFKKVVDKDLRCVYDAGIQTMKNELDDMSKWDIKSATISDYNIFSDEKDVVVATYTVALQATFNGKDMSGTYNAGTVWKKEGNNWMAIFHTHSKQAAAQ